MRDLCSGFPIFFQHLWNLYFLTFREGVVVLRPKRSSLAVLTRLLSLGLLDCVSRAGWYVCEQSSDCK